VAIAIPVKVISIGNSVPRSDAVFTIHSTFDRVANLLYPEGLVSVVTEDIGGGPNNIVVNGFNFLNLREAQIINDELILNDTKIFLSKASKYDPTIKLDASKKTAFLSGLQIFERVLIKHAHSLSSVFLLDNRRKSFFITPFEKNLRNQLDAGVTEILNGKLSSVEKIKGVGLGFTPQGDDLISGMLLALYVYQLLSSYSTNHIREEIYRLARSKNIISDAFLHFAAQGEFFERFKNLIYAFFQDKEVIINATMQLLAVGETSGADIGTGFILASKEAFKKSINGGVLIWQ
jgi:hypothetical protein